MNVGFWSSECSRAQDLDLIWRWPWVGKVSFLSSDIWWEGAGKTQPGYSQRYLGKEQGPTIKNFIREISIGYCHRQKRFPPSRNFHEFNLFANSQSIYYRLQVSRETEKTKQSSVKILLSFIHFFLPPPDIVLLSALTPVHSQLLCWGSGQYGTLGPVHTGLVPSLAAASPGCTFQLLLRQNLGLNYCPGTLSPLPSPLFPLPSSLLLLHCGFLLKSVQTKKSSKWSRESHQPGTCWFLISNAVQKVTHARNCLCPISMLSLSWCLFS